MRGLGRFYQLHILCQGEPNPRTGYFANIRDLDEAARRHALPQLAKMLADAPSGAAMPLGRVMQELGSRLQSALQGSLAELQLELTPYYSLTIRSRDMASIIIRDTFEFAAAHRLHVPDLSDQENLRIFGKCNRPSGHGHNYRLDVEVRAPVDETGGIMPVEKLEELVDEVVIQKLDHMNLNVDVPEFTNLNSSVENISRVVFNMLKEQVRRLGVELEQVSVWETSKTVCTYRG